MIKQDYLIRMIQEIISLIVNAILNKKKFRKDEWTEYDCLTRQILGVSQEELLSMSLDEITSGWAFLAKICSERKQYLFNSADEFDSDD